MVFARLRAYIGFLPVRRTLPNPTHYALAALQHASVVGPLITQNVDGLHHAALRRVFSEPEVDRRILELHGSIFVSPIPIPPAQHHATAFLLCLPGYERYILTRRVRKYIVNMDTFTLVQYSKSGLDRPTHAGAHSLTSSSVRGRNPRQIPTVMFALIPLGQIIRADLFFLGSLALCRSYSTRAFPTTTLSYRIAQAAMRKAGRVASCVAFSQ